MRIARLALALMLSLAALALVVPATSAHPLGNFTINHYSGLRVTGSAVLVDHVTDFAEIPTFAQRRAMDTDGSGDVSGAEAAVYERESCTALGTDLALAANGTDIPLTLTQTGITFPMGQGSPTMRLVCIYEAALPSPISGPTALTFADHSFAERQGWREIVVAGDGTTIVSSDAPASGTSDRLTHYPANLLTIPLGQAQAAFTAQAGGLALPAFSVPDAAPIAAGVDQATPAPQTPAGGAAVPAGATDLTKDVTALLQAPDLTPPVIALGLLVAVALGALHALSPGHGKTVMAAYLVGSRGNVRHAIGLGLTVTVSHTLGVLALGALSLSAAVVIPPERLYPILSIASGAIVVAIGGYLLFSRLRAWRLSSRPEHALEHGHDHGHEHAQAHEHEHEHAHEAAQKPPGWHDHDGIGHTHLPTSGMSKRGLFALGLSGGMIPSVSALLVLIGSISIGRPVYGVVLTVAFGVGMAAVLVGVGLALVYARRLVERLPVVAPLQLSRRLPLVTAAVVLVAGVLITGQGLVSLGVL